MDYFLQLIERLLAIEKLCMRLRQCVLPEINGLKEAVCEPSLVNEVNNLKIDVSFYNGAAGFRIIPIFAVDKCLF